MEYNEIRKSNNGYFEKVIEQRRRKEYEKIFKIFILIFAVSILSISNIYAIEDNSVLLMLKKHLMMEVI